MNDLKNLYIDESGRYYIGEPHYKFFMLSALVLTDKEKELSGLLFSKWRHKYLNDPLKSFHAYDFFEDGLIGYKKHELSFARNFNHSVSEIIEILKIVDLKAIVFYVDIEKLRFMKGIRRPPVQPRQNSTIQERQEYNILKKEYSDHIKSILPDKQKFLPLTKSLRQCFVFHETFLGSTNECGYINFESQSNSDTLLLETFHNYAPQNRSYGNKVLGIQLHTKRSQDPGIELSDLISYTSCQMLRSKHRRRMELTGIAPEKLDQLRRVQYYLREKLKIDIINVTNV